MPSYVITGVNRGIGYGWIKHLSQDPSNIVIGTVRDKNAADFTSRLDADGLSALKNLHIFEADVTDIAALKSIEPSVSAVTGGKLDYLINNAGYLAKESALTSPSQYLSKEEFLKTELYQAMDVNVLGCAYVTNVFLEQLRNGKEKRLVFVSSANGDFSFGGFTFLEGIAPAVPYSISKAAVNMLSAKYAVELKPEGIVVLSISPGLVNNTGKPKSEEEQKKVIERFGPGSKDQRFKGVLEPEESVKMQLNVINNATIDDSGRYLSHFGDDSWF